MQGVSCGSTELDVVYKPWVERGQGPERRTDAAGRVIGSLQSRRIEQLDLSGLHLREWPPGISQLTELVHLKASKNALPNFSGVGPCPVVRSLYLSDNPFESLTGIGQLFPDLRELFISRTRVTSVQPLAECPHLKILICVGTPVQDWNGIQQLPLEELFVTADSVNPRAARSLSAGEIKALQAS
jgi:hypothetical protein